MMPVPSAFNDLGGEDLDLQQHVGWVWYQTTYIFSKSTLISLINSKTRAFLRFGSVNYATFIVIFKILFAEQIFLIFTITFFLKF